MNEITLKLEKLVLGYMDSYDSNQIVILQHFSRSTRFTYFCTSRISKFWQKIGTDFRNEFLKNSFNFRKIFGKFVIFLLNRDEFFSEFHVHDEKMLKFLEMQAKFAKFSENPGKIRKRVTKFIPGMNNSIPSLWVIRCWGQTISDRL